MAEQQQPQTGAPKVRRDQLLNIEKQVQSKWSEAKIFAADAGDAKTRSVNDKYLATFPYPYMNGVLHLGHAFTLAKVDYQCNYQRLKGKNVIFPFAFHCTGMPIQAAADKLKREMITYGNPPIFPQQQDEPTDNKTNDANNTDNKPDESESDSTQTEDEKKTDNKNEPKKRNVKAKVAKKASKEKYQWNMLREMGVPENEIANFADAKYWLKYFPPIGQDHLTKFGLSADFRRSFITTDVNPYYDSFIRWQFNTLRKKDKIAFGARLCIFSPIDNQACFPAGTGITVGCGIARPIEQLLLLGEAVISCNGAAKLVQDELTTGSIGPNDRGFKSNLVRITLVDGRTLVCTDDHRLLTKSRGWQRADQLRFGNHHAINLKTSGKFVNKVDEGGLLFDIMHDKDMVPDELIIGPDSVIDNVVNDAPEDTSWSYSLSHVPDLNWSTSSGRARCLAFARVLGFVLGDGWVGSDRYAAGAVIGHQLDLTEFEYDVKLVSGNECVSEWRECEQLVGGDVVTQMAFSVKLPSNLARSLANLAGMVVGKRTESVPQWPDIVLSNHVPKAFIREFIAGYFGADGYAPCFYNKVGEDVNQQIHAIALGITVRKANVELARAFFGRLAELLARFGITRTYVNLRLPSESSFTAHSGNRDNHMVMVIHLQDGIEFASNIGFRYCWYKQCRLSVMASYWKFCISVGEQRLAYVKLVLKEVQHILVNNLTRNYLHQALTNIRFKIKHYGTEDDADEKENNDNSNVSIIRPGTTMIDGISCRVPNKRNAKGGFTVIRNDNDKRLCPHHQPGGCRINNNNIGCSDASKWHSDNNLARHAAVAETHSTCGRQCAGFGFLANRMNKRSRLDNSQVINEKNVFNNQPILHRQSQLSHVQLMHRFTQLAIKSNRVQQYADNNIIMDHKSRKISNPNQIVNDLNEEDEYLITYLKSVNIDDLTVDFLNTPIAMWVSSQSYCEAIGAKEMAGEKYAGFDRDANVIPSYHLPVVRVEKLAESKHVYDLSVKTNHSFVANSVVAHNCADHDRAAGEGVGITDYTLIKLELQKPYPETLQKIIKSYESSHTVYLPAATLRPETMYGQTNAWLLPEGDYGIYNINDKDIFICSERSALNMSYQNITRKRGEPELIGKIKGQELMGWAIKAPLTSYDKVHILPLTTIKMDKGTGVVTSVPSDAPDDYAALMDMKNKQAFREKYNIKPEHVLPFEIIEIINTPGLGNKPAADLCIEQKVVSQNDRVKLDAIKDKVYKEGFAKGIMLVGEYKGSKVSEAKPKIKQHLINIGLGLAYSEPESRVVSRSGNECVVALADQWYLKYGEEKWQAMIKEYVDNDKLDTYNPQAKIEFQTTIGWMHEWACSRSYGLGTFLPWDKQYVIESLSDSTIYMAYYTIAHLLQEGSLDGSKPGPANIQPQQLTDEVYNYIFLTDDNPNPPANNTIPIETLNKLRNEFMYWYPMNLRVSGKDLINNHLTMALYNHAAIWDKRPDLWPQSFFTNGHVMIDSKKMSKSEGNFITIHQAINEFSADATRFSLADAGDGLEDANFEKSVANAAILKLTKEEAWIREDVLPNINNMRDGPFDFADKCFNNDMNKAIAEADRAYSRLVYRDALKASFYDLQTARDSYRFNVKTLHKQLIQRYLQVSAILLSPICPHFTQHLWEITGNSKSVPFIMKASWPQSEPVDTLLTRQVNYLKDVVASIRKAYTDALAKVSKTKVKGADAKAAANQAGEDIANKIHTITLFVSTTYPQFQQQVIIAIKNLYEKNNNQIPERKEVVSVVRNIANPNNIDTSKKENVEMKKQLENATKFGNEVLVDLSSRGVAALELELSFDEVKLLEQQVGLMVNDIPIKRLAICNINQANSNINNDKVAASIASKAGPGRPSPYAADNTAPVFGTIVFEKQ